MPKDELDGLPVVDVPESENITVAVKPDDLQEGDEAGWSKRYPRIIESASTIKGVAILDAEPLLLRLRRRAEF